MSKQRLLDAPSRRMFHVSEAIRDSSMSVELSTADRADAAQAEVPRAAGRATTFGSLGVPRARARQDSGSEAEVVDTQPAARASSSAAQGADEPLSSPHPTTGRTTFADGDGSDAVASVVDGAAPTETASQLPPAGRSSDGGPTPEQNYRERAPAVRSLGGQ